MYYKICPICETQKHKLHFQTFSTKNLLDEHIFCRDCRKELWLIHEKSFKLVPEDLKIPEKPVKTYPLTEANIEDLLKYPLIL